MTHGSNKLFEDSRVAHTSPPPKSIQSFTFCPSHQVRISIKSFLMTFSPPIQRRPAFCLVAAGQLKSTIFTNVSPLIRKTYSSHINLYFIIALERGIKPNFLYRLLFVIRSFKWHSINILTVEKGPTFPIKHFRRTSIQTSLQDSRLSRTHNDKYLVHYNGIWEIYCSEADEFFIPE